jgi:hypothetical protein
MKISDLELRAKLWWLLAHLLSFAELLTGLFSTYCIGVSVAGRSNIFLGVIVGIVVCTVTVTIFWFFRMMVSTSMTSIVDNRSAVNALYHRRRYAAGVSEMIFSAKISCLVYVIVMAVCLFFSLKFS